jgi:hypothetical protein
LKYIILSLTFRGKHQEGGVDRMDQYKKSIEDVLKKCPPGYQVSDLWGYGAAPVGVTHFSNYDNGLAYFIADGRVLVYEADKIHGMAFGAADAAAEVEEEEEAEA